MKIKSRWGIAAGVLIVLFFPIKMAMQDADEMNSHQQMLRGDAADQAGELKEAEKTVKLTMADIKGAAAGTSFLPGELAKIPQEELFYQEEISQGIWERIWGKSYKEDCFIPKEELSYLRLIHVGFDGRAYVGELIVSSKIAADVLAIFKELYQGGYPIEKMILIDAYEAEDEASMADNNSSAFNYRQISHSTKLSKHSYGTAIDINPLYNPYVKTVAGRLICQPANAVDYMDRERDFPYKITKEDLCCRLFKAHGFLWGGDFKGSKDYQHFEK